MVVFAEYVAHVRVFRHTHLCGTTAAAHHPSYKQRAPSRGTIGFGVIVESAALASQRDDSAHRQQE